jgi:hypothetical protein
MKLTGENRSTGGKTYPSATLSTTNPTWTDQGSNLGISGERPATNRLSHGTAICYIYLPPIARMCGVVHVIPHTSTWCFAGFPGLFSGYLLACHALCHFPARLSLWE